MIRKLLPIILLPLLIMSALLFLFNFKAKEHPVTPVEIPDGWEVVSTENNCTYIRMKEGADSRVWFERTDNQNFFVDVFLPGGEMHVTADYGTEKSIPVMIYFGYGPLVYDESRAAFSIDPTLPPPDYTDYQLIMWMNADKSFPLLDLPDFTDITSVELNDQNEIGYTNGVILNIPVSLFENTTCRFVSFQLQTNQYFPDEVQSKRIYLTHDTDRSKLIVELERDAWLNGYQYGFPQIFNSPKPLFVLGTYTTILSVFISTLLSLIRKKRYGLPYLYIALAQPFNYYISAWMHSLNTDSLDFSFLLCIAAFVVYLHIAIAIGILQAFVSWIQKRIAERKAAKQSTASERPDESTPSTETEPIQ